MANLRKAQKESQKARILDAARQLFETETYAAVTIRRVSKLAGLSNTPVYSYFQNKEDLWRAAMGTAPPVDSALTRRAQDVEIALRQLLRLKAEGTVPASAWALAWSAAETALASGDEETPSTRPPDDRPPIQTQPEYGPIRLILIQDLLEAADRRGWAPRAFGDLTLVLTDVCQQLAHHRLGLTRPPAVYRRIIEAMADLLITATRGVADLPYRYDPSESEEDDGTRAVD